MLEKEHHEQKPPVLVVAWFGETPAHLIDLESSGVKNTLGYSSRTCGSDFFLVVLDMRLIQLFCSSKFFG